MEYILNNYHRNSEDKELIDDLFHVSKLINRDTVTIDEYNRLGKFHASTLTRRFGSWPNCLELAGLKESRSKINISEEELFQNLEELWKYFGRQPKYTEIKKPLSKFSAGTYEKRYGSYYKALEAFIYAMNGQIIDDKNKLTSGSKSPRTINYRLRFKIMQRDNFKCCICGASPAIESGVTLHIDHIVPCAKGGLATENNLQTLCSNCNWGKGVLDM